MSYHQLTQLEAGQAIVFGGDRVVQVPDDLAASFQRGDRLLVDDDGVLLHVTADQHRAAAAAIERAVTAFDALERVDDDAISEFFERFADRLADDAVFETIAKANRADVERARTRGRSTTRLVLSDQMRSAMIAGLRGWAARPGERHERLTQIEHPSWTVESWRAPLGVVGFVFEGRPNVFADAVGVLRTGNTVVFRIGSDALDTARAIVDQALDPALDAAGLPPGSVSLVDSAAHGAGWALFSDPRLALAVARGSGPAVAQLAAVARQAGNAVSLHGTGGAWLVADSTLPTTRVAEAVVASLDRKVCNTVNTICVVRDAAAELVPVVVEAVESAARELGQHGRIHATASARAYIPDEVAHRQVQIARADGASDESFVTDIDTAALGDEWEWEASPEVTVHVVDSVAEAIDAFNRYSPRFVASLLSADERTQREFYERVDAPFVGDGFTRWVDGQYALNTPELGLSNWEYGRLLGRGGILSGDSVFTVRYRATIHDPSLRR